RESFRQTAVYVGIGRGNSMSRQKFINRLLGSDQEREPIAVVVVNAEGAVAWGNPAAHRMLGYPNGSLRGQRVAEVLPEHAQWIHQVFKEGRPLRVQTCVPQAGGRSVDVNLTAQPMNLDAG